MVSTPLACVNVLIHSVVSCMVVMLVKVLFLWWPVYSSIHNYDSFMYVTLSENDATL